MVVSTVWKTLVVTEAKLDRIENGAAMKVPSHSLIAFLAETSSVHINYIRRRLPADLARVASPDDILQDAWCSIFQSVHSVELSGDEALSRWAITAINRSLIDTCRRLRRLKRGGRHVIIYEADRRAKSLQALFDRIASPQETPSSETSSKEAKQAMRLALACLPSAEYRAIQMYHLDGNSKQAIATAMKRTPAAVNSLIYRGKRLLRQHMGSASRYFSDA